MIPFDLPELALVLAVCWLGALVQAAVGFGLALIAAPLLLLVYPPLVPGPLTAASLLLTGLVAYRDRAGIDFRGIGWAMLGRVFGTGAAAVFLAVASARVFDIAFGVLVLLGVALSIAGLAARPARGSAIVAGGLSGLMGTVSSIGGPPMALLYQRENAEILRGTLAGFFVLGSSLSLVALALVGRFGHEEQWLSVVLAPPMALGFAMASPLRRRMSRGAIRPLVLTLSTLSAIAVLWRGLA